MDAVPTYRDEAVVLRTHKLGEADRIVTVLSRRHGKVRAVARGVRRTSSKFGARLEPFSHVDVQFATGRTLDVITEAVTLHALTSGTSDGPRPASMVMDAYLLRAVATAGFAPALAECAVCGAPGPHEAFSPASGGMVCRRCRPPASALLAPGTLDYLCALISGDWPATREATDVVRRQASGLIAAFVSWHLERGLRTLAYLDR